ncbi:FAD-binding protein [Paraburkholderia sp.]|uniref:FAD-binding protein n=1 Tax=Paraburkholderia sp. TaxID=1926495 RepID=UPI002388EFAF|nr:FAD-binding protein [Paraburkholderia sp.]MDE1179346.1 FAD-binding protein [Paraburkholderia sp.]
MPPDLTRLDCDVLVVGAGIGGLVSATQAAGRGWRTILATKGKIAGGASYFPKKASLGVQVTNDADDIEPFRYDIARAAQGMNDPSIVDAYLRDSPNVIDSLDAIGFEPWLRADGRPACFAAHARKIFMIGDWAGASQRARDIVAGNEAIVPLERTGLVRIQTEAGRVVGAVLERDGEWLLVRCKTMILATGGMASLYRHNLYPNHLYGGGHAAALEAGCELVNMEYIQFIPGLVSPRYKVLFGEHTLKYCTGMFDREGRDLLADMSASAAQAMWAERSTYAPFSTDYASRTFDTRMMQAIRAGSSGVRLTFHAALYEQRSDFYAVYLDWLKRDMGIDMCRDEICVAPFAHSCNGGIRIDDHGETAIAGLFAVGEVASAIEGANRLGGNSVGGSLVFARRAIETAARYIEADRRAPSFDEIERDFRRWCASFDAAATSTLAPAAASDMLRSVRERLWADANVLRDHASLSTSLDVLDALDAACNPLVCGFDAYHAVRVASVLMHAMRARTESRGAHFRSDFPTADPRPYRQIVSLRDGAIHIRREFDACE